MRRTKSNVTIRDVAAAAGVSVSTVSRVLNDKDDVAPETYERVQEVIRQLGYASSLAARGMRSRRTNVIGLIMPDVGEPFPIEVMRGVNEAIAAFDYHLIIYTAGDTRESKSAARERQYVSLLNSGITDGVIIVTPAATSFSTADPVVVVDPNNVCPDCATVIATNRAGALSATRYLLELGHRRIGFVGGRPELQSAVRRLQGYRDGLAEAGVPLHPELVEVGDYTAETGFVCGRRLLSLPDPPTAIFAANDQSAIGVMRAADEAGLSVPEDLSVVGFDNIPETAYVNPPLTTVDQFITRMGYTATEILMRLIEGESLDGDIHKIPTELVVRESCRAL